MQTDQKDRRRTRPAPNRHGRGRVRRRPSEDLPDSELLARASAGDGEAWASLVDRYDAMVHHVARRVGLSAADANDVSQTTWMRLVRNIARIREPERLPGWLRTTSRNEAVALAMRDTRRQVRETAQLAETRYLGVDDDPPLAWILDTERSSCLRAALQTLPDGRRQVVQLIANGASYDEVRDITGLPLGSIGPTWGRSIRMLRRTTQVARLADGQLAAS